MKKGIITMMALMLGMTGIMAQNKVTVAGAGDVVLRQGEQNEINEGVMSRQDDRITTTSYKDANLTLKDLRSLTVTGAGDVFGEGQFKGDKLSITSTGTGDIYLNIDYDTVSAVISGVGDVSLNGRCHYLKATVTGLGDLEIGSLQVDTMAINKIQNGEYHWDWKWNTNGNGAPNNGPKTYKSLLLDPHWKGVDAGLNILLNAGPNGEWTGDYALLQQRPLKSWNFNFNIADIGLAFTKTHRAGVYTGIGLGWNNFSFNKPTRLEKGEQKLICHAVNEEVEGDVRRSKLGVLYLQAPLMIEVRPSRHTYIAAGVTGGFRIDIWSKIKYQNGDKEKAHSDYYIERFKLDASLRAGGDDLGFYANFNLLPFFIENKAENAHSVSFGLSVNF